MPLCEPSHKGFSFDWPQPQNFGFSIVSITLPSASTISTTPVMRIDPLLGLMKAFASDIARTDLFNRGNRVVIANVKGGVASTLSLIQSDEYVRGLRREPFRFHQGSLADHL